MLFKGLLILAISAYSLATPRWECLSDKLNCEACKLPGSKLPNIRPCQAETRKFEDQALCRSFCETLVGVGKPTVAETFLPRNVEGSSKVLKGLNPTRGFGFSTFNDLPQQCHTKFYDLTVIADSSVTGAEWEMQKQWLKTLAGQLPIGEKKMHMSVWQTCNNPLMMWNLLMGANAFTVNRNIDNMKQVPSAGVHNFLETLNKVVYDGYIHEKTKTLRPGNRRLIPNRVIMMAGSKSSTDALEKANKMRRGGFQIFVIAVLKKDDVIARKQLKDIAGSPEMYYEIPSWSFLNSGNGHIPQIFLKWCRA